MAKLHDDEVDIDESLVRRLLSAQFPEIANEPIEFVSTSGTVNVIYRLGEDKCIRLPRVQRYADHLALELEWLPRIAPVISLDVPKPLASGEPVDEYPFAWAVYEWLPGEQFDAEALGDQPDSAIRLADFIKEFSRLEVSGAPKSTRDAPMRFFDKVVCESLAAITEHGMRVDVEAASEIWNNAIALPSFSGERCWIHGDLLPVNVLSDNGTLSAIIDFGLAGIGDPAVDVIPAWAIMRGKARQVFREALDVDDETWARGRAFALRQAILIIPYYRQTNPPFVEMAIRTTEEVIADYYR